METSNILPGIKVMIYNDNCYNFIAYFISMISGLKIPKLIRWIFSIGIIFLIIMTLLRLSLYLFFNDQGNRFRDILDSLWLGIRFDLRMVCILLTVILVVGSFKK